MKALARIHVQVAELVPRYARESCLWQIETRTIIWLFYNSKKLKKLKTHVLNSLKVLEQNIPHASGSILILFMTLGMMVAHTIVSHLSEKTQSQNVHTVFKSLLVSKCGTRINSFRREPQLTLKPTLMTRSSKLNRVTIVQRIPTTHTGDMCM